MVVNFLVSDSIIEDFLKGKLKIVLQCIFLYVSGKCIVFITVM